MKSARKNRETIYSQFAYYLLPSKHDVVVIEGIRM